MILDDCVQAVSRRQTPAVSQSCRRDDRRAQGRALLDGTIGTEAPLSEQGWDRRLRECIGPRTPGRWQP